MPHVVAFAQAQANANPFAIDVESRPFAPAPSYGKRHVITERTSKRYKGMQVLGALTVLLGFIGIVAAASQAKPTSAAGVPGAFPAVIVASILAIIVGLCIYVAARILAWWHHG